MPGTVDDILAAGHELADLYADAVKDLSRHWPDEIGVCLGCGEPYPCAEEWITQRAIAGIERRWRRQGQQLAAIRLQQTAQDRAATDAADNEGQDTR